MVSSAEDAATSANTLRPDLCVALDVQKHFRKSRGSRLACSGSATQQRRQDLSGGSALLYYLLWLLGEAAMLAAAFAGEEHGRATLLVFVLQRSGCKISGCTAGDAANKGRGRLCSTKGHGLPQVRSQTSQILKSRSASPPQPGICGVILSEACCTGTLRKLMQHGTPLDSLIETLIETLIDPFKEPFN